MVCLGSEVPGGAAAWNQERCQLRVVRSGSLSRGPVASRRARTRSCRGWCSMGPADGSSRFASTFESCSPAGTARHRAALTPLICCAGSVSSLRWRSAGSAPTATRSATSFSGFGLAATRPVTAGRARRHLDHSIQGQARHICALAMPRRRSAMRSRSSRRSTTFTCRPVRARSCRRCRRAHPTAGARTPITTRWSRSGCASVVPAGRSSPIPTLVPCPTTSWTTVRGAGLSPGSGAVRDVLAQGPASRSCWRSATTAWSSTGCPPPVSWFPCSRSSRRRPIRNGSWSSARNWPMCCRSSSAGSAATPRQCLLSGHTTGANACGPARPRCCSSAGSAPATAESVTARSGTCSTPPWPPPA